MAPSFEQGPIRPPSEAQSLLIRLSRNCNWNQCLFCPVYKGRKFSRRSIEEIKADIDAVAEVIAEVREASLAMGFAGKINTVVAQYFFERQLPQSYLSVVAWLYHGKGSVFLQDANSFILSSAELIEILNYLNDRVSGITRITSYARSSSVARKTEEELLNIRNAGLDRVHVGLESGYDPLLKFMKKGVTAREHIEAGRKIKTAGMELSEYYMPGLGGRLMWREHAIETARVLNAVNPDFIRLRTLRIPKRIELYARVKSGEFEPIGDDEIVEEIRLFVETLDGITSYVASDHMMNLLQDVEGRMPDGKAHMLETIDRYRALSKDDRLHYRLGRRLGMYHGVADMSRPELYVQVQEMLAKINAEKPAGIETFLNELADRTI